MRKRQSAVASPPDLQFEHPAMPEEESRADFLELFAGEARFSQAFATRQKKVLQPYDLRFGHDLRNRSTQAEVLELIGRERPKFIWAAPPCTEWCAFSRLNHSPQERRRRRAKEVTFLKFLSEVLDRQRAQGGHLAVENPRSSDMWRHPEVEHWIRVPGTYFAEVDLCQYGLLSVVNGAPLRKGLSIFTTSSGLAEAIATRCAGDHVHQPVQGADTGRSAAYPPRFAKAVAKAFCQGRLSDAKHHDRHQEVQQAHVTDNPAAGVSGADDGSIGAPSITFKGQGESNHCRCSTPSTSEPGASSQQGAHSPFEDCRSYPGLRPGSRTVDVSDL